MTTLIIIQILVAVIGTGGAIAGYVKLPKKQKVLVPTIVLIVTIVASILIWTV